MSMSEARQRLVYAVLRRYARGESMRAIGRAERIDPKTVKRILREADERRRKGDDVLERLGPKPRAPRGSKLDAYGDEITALIKRYPDITAVRLHEELQARGFKGGYTIVRERLKALRPKPTKRAAMVVRTAPGQQAQVDWSPYDIADGSTIHALSVVLGFSRYRYFVFTTDMRRPTLFEHLRRAFETFGGVPDELVFDSMKTVVDRWESNTPILNLHALDFAAYYDFHYHIAPRADGAYKGKVERPFRHADENFFNARTFYSIEQANETLRRWLQEKVHDRPHGTTRKRPSELFEEERPLLKPLPSHPYDTRELAYRIVDGYHHVHFDDNFYSVAERHVGEQVYVRASLERVEIFDARAEKLASHERAPRGGGEYRTLDEHKRPKRHSMPQLMARFEAWGEAPLRFARLIRERKRYAGKELAAIIALQRHWALDDLLAAIEHALHYQAIDAASVERILHAHAEPRTLHDVIAQRAREQVRRSLAVAPVEQRKTSYYAGLLSGEGEQEPADATESPHDNDDEDEPPP
jgi:transposase